MTNRITTGILAAGMVAASLFGAAPAGAAPAPAAPTKTAPVLTNHTGQVCHSDWQCWENFNNCNTADASSGQLGVKVTHRQSSSGASTQVIAVQYSATSTASYYVDWTQKTSGGGGTLYWFRNDPIGATATVSSGSAYSYIEVGLPFASFSANPVVAVNYDHTGSTTDTRCNVVLDKSKSVISIP